MHDQTDLAWAAGFFDGEGSTMFHKIKNRKPNIRIDVTQKTKGNLDRFFESVGCIGNVYGPFNPPSHSAYYSYRAIGKTAITVLGKLWIYLGPEKRAQAETILSEIHINTNTDTRKKHRR